MSQDTDKQQAQKLKILTKVVRESVNKLDLPYATAITEWLRI